MSVPRDAISDVVGSPEITNLYQSFREQGPEAGLQSLRHLLSEPEKLSQTGLPIKFLSITAEALETNDWSKVARGYVNNEFVGKDGWFALVAPYQITRTGKKSTGLTGIYGQLIATPPLPDFNASLRELFDRESESIMEVLPFRCFASFGYADGDAGEAFIVPDGWMLPGGERGRPLNNMTAQSRRFSLSAKRALRTIFAESSAELLLKPLEDALAAPLLRSREFQYHEAGHASGIGLRHKIKADVLRTTWYGGVEEWRADGVEFALLGRELGPSEAGRTIASNYCLRFGVDAHRAGGVERDTDVMATMLSLNSLLKTRALRIDENRQLQFRNESYTGLFAATIDHREDAVQLTRDELTLNFDEGIWSLYGSMSVERATRLVFDGLVQYPCRDIMDVQLR